MKEVTTTYTQMNKDRRHSVNILIDWLDSMYREYNIKNYYSTWNWLKDVRNDKVVVYQKDLNNLKELWDIYSLYKKQTNEDTKHTD